MSTRREFLKTGAAGLGVVMAGSYAGWVIAATDGPLSDAMAALCRRLGAAGWREMLLDVTGGEFDILAPDLRKELVKPLTRIDRSYPGFGDFAARGNKGIEPGQPDYSLLYHALAAPSVVTGRDHAVLGTFPTLAEIETVENYIYAVKGVSLSLLRADIGARPLAIVVFALQYRNAPMSVHGRHAQLCFARTGIARIGNLEPRYDPQLRSFSGVDEDRPFDFHVVPRRFAAYLAVQRPAGSGGFGPQDALSGDSERKFWVPVHKLFSGKECLAGMDLHLELGRSMLNDELASFHRFLQYQGLANNWSGQRLEEFPFSIRDERIASLSATQEYGAGVLVPQASALVEEAQYEGRRLTFPVDAGYSGKAANLQLSSLFILPGAEPPKSPQYLDDAEQHAERPAPEYINIRHRVVNGEIDNLNDRPDMMEILRRGGYDAQHYIDFSGDGWIQATSPELAGAGVTTTVPAFCMVGLPDFLPRLGQRELMLWWQNEVPQPLRAALWATPPLALSQTRIAANIELPAGFSPNDDTISAVVSQVPTAESEPSAIPSQNPNGALRFDKVGLPDGSPGLFDPGWDGSIGIRATTGGTRLQRFLVSHGLGSPFIEDAKLCAALGSYWPGVAPDATRQYQPDKRLSGISYPWPTAVPLTDEELGMVPVAQGPLQGRYAPWDGVRGPTRREFDGRTVVAYEDQMRVDYIDLQGKMTAALTARINLADYQARTLSMAAVYWSLGIRQGDPARPGNVNRLLREKAAWAVLSFRTVPVTDPELVKISSRVGAKLDPQRRHYRFEVFRWGKQHADPKRLLTSSSNSA